MPQNPHAACLARVTRGGRLESEHFGQIVVADAEGTIRLSAGDPNVQTYLRSSAKPFQAAAVLHTGAAEQFGWSLEQIAVVCASHHAEPEHLEIVRSILSSAKFTEDDLQCGPHPPIHVPARDELIRTGMAPSKIHNNCSGKHAGMLAACRVMGWDAKSYLEPSHPLQQLNRQAVASFATINPTSIHTGVDGCGVPTFYLTIRNLAGMYARLAVGMKQDEEWHASAERVGAALSRHPRLVSGTGHLTQVLSEQTGGRVFSKGGAEGVLGIGIPEWGLGIAIKCSDGSSRSLGAITCGVLADLLPDLDWAAITAKVVEPIKNTRGAAVGTIEAVPLQ